MDGLLSGRYGDGVLSECTISKGKNPSRNSLVRVQPPYFCRRFVLGWFIIGGKRLGTTNRLLLAFFLSPNFIFSFLLFFFFLTAGVKKTR